MSTIPTVLYGLIDTIYDTIYLYGSWDNWTKGIRVEVLSFRCVALIYAIVYLPPGSYQYKFHDEASVWFHNRNKPYVVTPEGYINNVVVIYDHGLRDGFSPQCEKCIRKADIIKGKERLCIMCLIESYNKEAEYDVIHDVVTIV